MRLDVTTPLEDSLPLMPGIHLIAPRRLNVNPAPDAEGEGEWESGNWALTEATAAGLVGGDLYLHEKKSEPSYFGGTILGFRRLSDGDDADKVVFRFRFTAAHRGATTPRDGWSQDKKIIA